MSRDRLFGWSYPPGCSGPPDDDCGPIRLDDGDPDVEAYWHEDGQIDIIVHHYNVANVDWNDDETDEQNIARAKKVAKDFLAKQGESK